MWPVGRINPSPFCFPISSSSSPSCDMRYDVHQNRISHLHAAMCLAQPQTMFGIIRIVVRFAHLKLLVLTPAEEQNPKSLFLYLSAAVQSFGSQQWTGLRTCILDPPDLCFENTRPVVLAN